MTLLLPNLTRGLVRRIRWPVDSTVPVVAGDSRVLADGRIEAGYDVDEFWRALVLADWRGAGRLPKRQAKEWRARRSGRRSGGR